MQFARGKPKGVLEVFRVPDDFIVLNEKERVIKEQSQVAEIFNEDFLQISQKI